MYGFTYHRPSSVAEAASLLEKAAEGQALAGGMSLIPTMKLRLSAPSDLVDLNGMTELGGILRRGPCHRGRGSQERHEEREFDERKCSHSSYLSV